MGREKHNLDNAVWAALSGPQKRFAQILGKARKFPNEMSPFGAIQDLNDQQSWRDLEQLLGPGGTVVLTGAKVEVPSAWEISGGGTGLQMTGEMVFGAPDSEAVELKTEDVPEMLELISRTQPGPFMARTIEFGGYVGLRDEGKLIAMAGRRMNPPGWVEISAVCTDLNYQRRGIGARLVNAVADSIRREGNVPFLHVSESNTSAIHLYEKLGFGTRMRSSFKVVIAPE